MGLPTRAPFPLKDGSFMTFLANDPQKKAEIKTPLGDRGNAGQFYDYLVNDFGIAVPNRWLKPTWSEMCPLRVA